MTVNQVFWLLAFWIVLWAGKNAFEIYLDHQIAIKRLELTESHNRLLDEFIKKSVDNNAEFYKQALDTSERKRKIQDRLEQEIKP